ncbi:hypothetical protein FG386_001318 [Cryptosporidium ryanae]|uniref:uncharacterized protein n=1 Tax=Cryptosporidium ryanae TaxID=515981 RepID=UPI00351A792C|nr:hypothetical protein FG386_001318 [Cryptosporidium ryanae]
MKKKDPKIGDLALKNDSKKKKEELILFSPNKKYFKRRSTESNIKSEYRESVNYSCAFINNTETDFYFESMLKEFSKLFFHRDNNLKCKKERLNSILNEKVFMFVDDPETVKSELNTYSYKNEVHEKNLKSNKTYFFGVNYELDFKKNEYASLRDENLREGSLCKVLYLTESGIIYTEKYHVIHLKTIIKEIMNIIKLRRISIINLICKLSIVRISSHSPNILWNIVRVFGGKVISGISRMLDLLSTNGFYLSEDKINGFVSCFTETNKGLELSEQLEIRLKEKIPYFKKMYISYVSEIDPFGGAVINSDYLNLNNSFKGNESVDEDCGAKLGLRKSNRISFGINNEDLIVKTCIDSKYKLFKTSISEYPDKWKQEIYKYCILQDINSPILIKKDSLKGRCVIAGSRIRKDDFVLEYKGYLITNLSEAQLLENIYEKANKGCYMYYFKYNDRNYCIDATEESIYFGPGRLINHSKKNPNLITRIMMLNKIPRLFFISKRDLECGEELLFDYGDRNPISILHNPWLLDS